MYDQDYRRKEDYWYRQEDYWYRQEDYWYRQEDYWYRPEGDIPAISVSALLRAHSTCHRDVVPLLYSQKTFMLQDVEDFVDWVARIGPSNTALIRSLTIRYTTPVALDYHGQFFETLAHLSGIRSLAIGTLGPRFLWLSSNQGQREPWHPLLLLFAQEILKELPRLTLVYENRGIQYGDQIRFATAEDDGPHESTVDESLITLLEVSEDFKRRWSVDRTIMA